MFLTNRKKYRQNITKKKTQKKKKRCEKEEKKNIETKISRTNRLPSPKYHRISNRRGPSIYTIDLRPNWQRRSINSLRTDRCAHRCIHPSMCDKFKIPASLLPQAHALSYRFSPMTPRPCPFVHTHTYTHSLFLSPYSSYSLVLVQSLVPRNHCPRPVLE